MARVRIVTDSTASIPEEQLQKYGIKVVPLSIQFGQESYLDGVEIGTAEFYERLGKGEMPSTSQPSPGKFADVYRELTQNGDAVLSIHISRKLSGTCQSAQLAREQFPGSTIEVVDSEGVSMLLGFAVLEAARAAEAGKSVKEVIETVNRVKEKVFGYITLPTLTYLERSGRLSKGAAFIGGLLSVKPIISMKNGELTVVEKVRTFSQSVQRILEITRDKLKNQPCSTLAVLHTNALDQARVLAEQAKSVINCREILYSEMGPTLAVSGGPRILGLAAYPG